MRGTGGVVGDVAIQLAQGASMGAALTNSLKGATLGALLGPSVLFAGTMVGVLKTIKAIVDQSGILERGLKRIAGLQQIQGQMEILMRSTVQAAARMKELQAFASKSPFNLSDIAEGNRQLQALTQGALAGTRGMQLIGDAAAATGQSFSETAAGVGKLYAAISSGRSLERVLFILQRDGVVTQELADKLEVAKESGMAVSGMLDILTTHLERATGAMSKEMETLVGLNKRLDETTKAMEQVAAEPFLKAQEDSIKTTIKLLDSMTPLIKRIATDMAPIMTSWSWLKNLVVSNTVATKGFASALGTVWEVAKPFIVGLAAVAVGQVGGALLGAGMKGKALFGAAKAGKKSATFEAGMEDSAISGGQAAAALAGGELLKAGYFKAQSLWAKVSANAIRLNTAAMVEAKAAAGGYTVVTHALNLATLTLVGGLSLLKAALIRLGTALTTTVMGPLAILATLVMYAGFAITSWADKTADAANAQIDLIQRTATLNRELREQIKNIKTLNDLTGVEAKIDKEIADTEAAIKAKGSRPEMGYTRQGVLGTTIHQDDSKGVAHDEDVNILRGHLARLKSRKKSLPDKRTLPNEERDAADALTMRGLVARQESLAGYERTRGREVAPGGMQKELLLAKQQLAFAREAAKFKKDPALEVAATEAQARVDAAEGAIAEARKNAGLERAANDQTIAGSPNQAQALRDNAERAKMQAEYEDAGMTAQQADSDWAANIKAQATGKTPRIIADSLQAIGGGGGSAGTDPMLAATERIRLATTTNSAYLQRIAVALEGARSTGIGK